MLNNKDLEKLTKSQLIKLLLKQNIELERPTLKSRTRPISALRKSVKQMQEYEGNNMPQSMNSEMDGNQHQNQGQKRHQLQFEEQK